MPLVHIHMRAGKSEAYKQAIFDSLYQALHQTYTVPEDDEFMTLTEHEQASFRYSRRYLGVTRSDDLVLVQITVSNTRRLEQKKALFSRATELLGQSPGLRPEDVFINLVEVGKENWSMGMGVATYV
ncbi:tautomerase family protein [Comamonas composti]|uniref:tautomerase family protein n=1 Tax=Comamonas composti TaxID=408558 RepID=UPI0003FDD210|nr:tautomerase family protein [Comamonas composti]